MIINFLRFRFRDQVDQTMRERALAAIRRTASSASVAFSLIGQDLGDPAEGYTHAYCVGVADLAALDAYLSEPAHRQGDEIFLPLLAKLSRAAASDEKDPELRERIGQLMRRRLEADPGWAALFGLVPDLRLG
jgi:hypothetical protein